MLNEIMQGVHSLFYKSTRIPDMDVQEVDIFCLKAFEAGRDLVEDCPLGEPASSDEITRVREFWVKWSENEWVVWSECVDFRRND